MRYKSKKLIRKLCKPNVNKRRIRNLTRVLYSCERLSASMYLPMRHDEVGKVVYNAIIKHHFPTTQYVSPRSTWTNNHIGIWWDTHATTVPKVKISKSDMVVWNKAEGKCFIVDFYVPLGGGGRHPHIAYEKKSDFWHSLPLNTQAYFSTSTLPPSPYLRTRQPED